MVFNKGMELKGSARLKTKLQVGDAVMVLAGGNSVSGKELKGRVGKILRFLPKKRRVVVEGLNFVCRHRRASSATDPGGIVKLEASLDISNVMYYSHDLKMPVRLKYRRREDGRKVRGYVNGATNVFEQIGV